MMKNFGAVLIVSGGYFIGWVRVRQWKQRLDLLKKVDALIRAYFDELKRHRRSLQDSLSDNDSVAQVILSGGVHKALLKVDQLMIGNLVDSLKNSSYQQSIVLVEDFLSTLEKTIEKLQEETASQGKALPLVTGAIGFLIAVLLY